MKRKLSRIAVIGLGAAGVAIAGCSGAGIASRSTNEDVGSVGMHLMLGNGSTVNEIHYTLTGPNGVSRTDTADVSSKNIVDFVITNLPPGAGYSITLDASATDPGDTTTCHGASGMFSVTSGAVTPVAVH